MGKNKFYLLLLGTSGLSAVIGVMLGYFVFGPIGISAYASIDSSANAMRYENASTIEDYIADEPLYAYVTYDKAYTPFEPEISEISEIDETEPMHNFIVTTANGFIVVYFADGKADGQLKEITQTPTNALPQEEQERLAQGIRIYTEEALMRILEDYGS
ncbi:MAG: BofC C-terminal domain-containing protein [Defluviitaleaceae bacterium]|nr:BofC C-terminal domain-containing protein [Defluviitaleaceae bacterium]